MSWTILPAPAPKRPGVLQSLLGGLAAGAPGALQQLADQKEHKDASTKRQALFKSLGLDTQGENDPNVLKMLLENQQNQQKVKINDAENLRKETEKDELISGIERERGLEPGALKSFRNDPKLAASITKPKEPSVSNKEIDPAQMAKIRSVRAQPGYEDLDETGRYNALTEGGVSSNNAKNEAEIKAQQLNRQQKAVQASHKAQEDFIKNTTSSYKAFETETKPRLMQMQSIPDEQVVGPTASVFLEGLGIPLGALENPSSELFQKLSLDLLKGLPETYGNRILKVEVDNFLKTIPSLMNSPEGRRMIASNMLKLGEMKEVFYNEMRRQQKDFNQKGKPFPNDFEQEIFDQVKPSINRINNQFSKMAQVTSVPKGTVAFFSPSDEIEFVPKEHIEWAEKNGGSRIW